MAVRTVVSFLLVLCVTLIGEVIGGSGHRHRDHHDDDDRSHDKDDDDDDDKGSSHVMIIGGFVCGAILVATAVVIVTFCCLKKAKKPERLINPEKSGNIAVLGSSAPPAYGLPHSKYIRPNTPRGPTAPGEPFNVPAKGTAPVDVEKAVPGLEMPPPYPSSPPPAYTKQISVKDGGLYD